MATLQGTATSGVPGVEGDTSTDANGVKGTSTSGWAGVYGLSTAAGAGVAGECSATSGGYGVYGIGPADAYGVYGTGGLGVFGTSSASGGTGVGGQSTSYIGVQGHCDGTAVGTYGVYGFGRDGVFGQASSGSGAGIVGYIGQGWYAGYFDGYVHVAGDFTVSGTKSFLIDHPLDPENKYLQHSCVESPDIKNIYDGVATADDAGEAVIRMPSYFEALNEDFRYQLTPIGNSAPQLYLKREIESGTFIIGGAAPGQRVSWQITGIRKDAAAKANPLVVERDKPAEHKGLFLNPEAFGLPKEKGVDGNRPQPEPPRLPALPPPPEHKGGVRGA